MRFWNLKRYGYTNKKNDNTSQNDVDTDGYARIFRRLTEISSDVEQCRAQVKILQTDVDNLRGNFNRKLKGIEQTEKQEAKDINTSEFIPIG
jgi:hypothetical protein